MTRADRLPDIARYQAGTFTRAQAYDDGWTRRQVDGRLAGGRWRLLCGDAIVCADRPVSADGWAWGAHLTWPFAVVSHLTAAALHRFPVDLDDRAHVTVAVDRRSIRGLRVHRTPLDERDVVRCDVGPAVTSRTRTALDCLRWLPCDEAARLFAWLSTRGLVSREELRLEIAATPGRRGTPQLARVLAVSRGGALGAAERLMHDILRKGRVVGWTANTPIMIDGVTVAVADILFARAKLIIEIDGYASHSDRSAFVHDRRRQNRLQMNGYLVLRFTWADLTQRPDDVLQEILLAIATRS